MYRDVADRRHKRMRITIIIGPFYPVPTLLGGAVEKVQLLLAGAYRAAGHEVTIISRSYKSLPTEEKVDGITHLRITSYNRTFSLALNLLLDFIYAIRVTQCVPQSDITVTNSFFVRSEERRVGKECRL